jgi:hypothetical protein
MAGISTRAGERWAGNDGAWGGPVDDRQQADVLAGPADGRDRVDRARLHRQAGLQQRLVADGALDLHRIGGGVDLGVVGGRAAAAIAEHDEAER